MGSWVCSRFVSPLKAYHELYVDHESTCVIVSWRGDRLNAINVQDHFERYGCCAVENWREPIKPDQSQNELLLSFGKTKFAFNAARQPSLTITNDRRQSVPCTCQLTDRVAY